VPGGLTSAILLPLGAEVVAVGAGVGLVFEDSTGSGGALRANHPNAESDLAVVSVRNAGDAAHRQEFAQGYEG
jgi:hypothetical protein